MKSNKKTIQSPGDSRQPETELAEELEELLEQVIIEEASQAVWEQFERALYQLDKESLDLLEGHLDGVPTEELSKERKITPAQASDLISRLKRDLNQQIKKSVRVRQ